MDIRSIAVFVLDACFDGVGNRVCLLFIYPGNILELGLDGLVKSSRLRKFRPRPHRFLRVASQPRSDWAQRVKEVEQAATRSDERARLAEDSFA